MNDDQTTPGDPTTGDSPGSTTTEEPRSEEPGVDAQRLRSLSDVQRPVDDRLVAGVSTGIARHLDIDPVLVRIGFAVLTFLGGAGIILYAGAWFLLPTTQGPSPVADWFKLDDTEEKVRNGGLVLTAALAALTIIGDGGWGGGWGWGVPWGLIPLALLVYVFVVRPRRSAEERRARREWADDMAARSREMGREAGDRAAAAANARVDEWKAERQERRSRRSGALTGLTLSLTVIALALTRIVADQNGGTPWTTYVAVALAVVGVGLLISTLFGDGGPLIALGIVLAVVLAIGSVLPSPRIGQQTVRPETVAELSSTYDHGVGQLDLDLTALDDPDSLVGRTISLENGVGQTRVIVPDGLKVTVDSHLDLGEIRVFNRTVNGTDNQIDLPGTTSEALNLTIDQSVGDIEVTSR